MPQKVKKASIMTIHLLRLIYKLFSMRLPAPTTNVSNHHNDSSYKPEDFRNKQGQIFQWKIINTRSSHMKMLGNLILQIELRIIREDNCDFRRRSSIQPQVEYELMIPTSVVNLGEFSCQHHFTNQAYDQDEVWKTYTKW